MSDELARALVMVLDAVEAYDKEQPVQTRLQTKHEFMRTAMAGARAILAIRYMRTLDGAAAPQYVTADYPQESVTL